MSQDREEGVERLGDILAKLFVARGWGRRQGRKQLERAWEEAVGPEHAAHTRVSVLRRGILEVEVNSPILLQELAHFHKRRLIERLQGKVNAALKDIRFRSGTW